MTIILKPQLSDAEIAEFVDKTKKYITHEGGEIVSEEKMGRRKLAHEINHIRDGFYAYMKFKSEPKLLASLNQQLRVNESVLRSMAIKNDEKEIVKPAVKPPQAGL